MKSKNKRQPIALILGTRPEIIKLSPLIRLLEKRKRPYFIIHTGQHYSYEMSRLFFKELSLPDSHWEFTRPSSLGSNKHSELIRLMQERIEGVLRREKPFAVLVQGDTDTVVAGARAAAKIGGITIGHVEAGLRSGDLKMPEERNRIVADGLSHILFAPTEFARKNLLREKLNGKRIEVTGNTIVDALFQNLKVAEKRSGRKKFKKPFALVTLHRPETVDDPKRLRKVIEALDTLVQKKSLRIIFPVHPRTRKRLEEFGIDQKREGFIFPDPMGFLDFIQHEKNADIILTDSGGVQEEACILRVPCVTIRTTTERPETVKAGGNVVVGYDPARIVRAALAMMDKPRQWKNPFGDGKASIRILAALERP